MSDLSRGANAILNFLKANKSGPFSSRTKTILKENVIQDENLLNESLRVLSKDGYIRTYFNPNLKTAVMSGTKHDETVGYIIRTAGVRFLTRGGYKE